MEFVLGLLDRHDPACVTWEDFTSTHGLFLRQWQRRGVLAKEPERNPAPGCPHCLEGVPHPLGERLLCPVCLSVVDGRHLSVWRFDLSAFLTWLARTMKLTANVCQVDESLWQLGSLRHGDFAHECFFRRGSISDIGRRRLLAYRNALLFQGPPLAHAIEGFQGPCLSLVEILRQDRRSITVTDPARLLRFRSDVRFDDNTGALFVGDRFLGEVPIGTKEYHLLTRLWQERDRFVAYADLKHYVLRQTGSGDTTDEATFCHKLKGRIKDRGWVPMIDDVIATTNKGEGYRLRGHLKEGRSHL